MASSVSRIYIGNWALTGSVSSGSQKSAQSTSNNRASATGSSTASQSSSAFTVSPFNRSVEQEAKIFDGAKSRSTDTISRLTATQSSLDTIRGYLVQAQTLAQQATQSGADGATLTTQANALIDQANDLVSQGRWGSERLFDPRNPEVGVQTSMSGRSNRAVSVGTVAESSGTRLTYQSRSATSLATNNVKQADASAADSVAVDSAGNRFIAGVSATGNNLQVWKLDSSGNQVWSEEFSSITGSLTQVNDVNVGSDGKVYVTGTVGSSYPTMEVFVGQIDPTKSAGNRFTTVSRLGARPELSTTAADSKKYPIAQGIVTTGGDNSRDFSIYVTGSFTGSFDGVTSTNQAAFLTKYTATYNGSGQRTGLVKSWSTAVNTDAVKGDQGTAITADTAGNIYVMGNAAGNFSGKVGIGRSDIFVQKYAANFDPNADISRPISERAALWTTLVGNTENQDAGGIVVDSATNKVYVSGVTSVLNGGGTSLYGVPVQTSDGINGFVAELSSTSGAVNTSGGVAVFGDAGTEQVTGIAMSSTGKLYVSGATYGSSSWYGESTPSGDSAGLGNPLRDSFIVAFSRDSSGALIRDDTLISQPRFGSTGTDWATDITSAPDGSIQVVGRSNLSMTGATDLSGASTSMYKMWTTKLTESSAVKVAEVRQGVTVSMIKRFQRVDLTSTTSATQAGASLSSAINEVDSTIKGIALGLKQANYAKRYFDSVATSVRGR